MKNKIEFIKVNTENSLYHDAEVKYEEITNLEKIEGYENVVDVLSHFSMQEGMLLDDLLRDKKVVIEKIVKQPVNKKSNIRIISLVLAGVLAVVGGTYIYNKNSKYKRDDKDVTKKIEEVSSTPIPTLEPTITPNSYQSIEKVTIPGNHNQSRFNENLDKEYVELDDLCIKVRAFNSGEDRSKASFDRIINGISNECYSNIDELCNFIKGNKMTGDIYIMNFKNAFDKDTIDYFVLDKFCKSKNDIIVDAHFQNQDSTKIEISRFLEELTSFVMGNKPVYNGQNVIYFQDLNNFSILFLEDLNLFMLLPDVNNSINVNGNNINKAQIMNELQEYIDDTCQSIEKDVSKVKKY